MRVKVNYRGQELDLELGEKTSRARDVLRALGLSREYAFVVRDDEVLEENEPIREGDYLRVINAISGGYI